MHLTRARTLITGCSSGIGRATAEALHRAGADVWATARDVRAIEALSDRGMRVLALDVRDDSNVRQVVKSLGWVDVLVNNAGYGLEGAVEEVSDSELHDQYDTNVFGPWRLCRAVLSGMRERGTGVIVNVSSFGGQAPFPGIGAYRSSKFALEGLTWSLHLEVARFGIRVISIQPGLVDSDFGTRSIRRAAGMMPGNAYEAMRESAARAYPLMSPRALPSEVVADAIVAELARDAGPLHVRVGEDAERMIAAVQAGDEAYERYLGEHLGFDWFPVGGLPGPA
jgi:NAD(P)-dependent dehydrogenase (short-subunit alcohol dehydrogenase family)